MILEYTRWFIVALPGRKFRSDQRKAFGVVSVKRGPSFELATDAPRQIRNLSSPLPPLRTLLETFS